MRSLSLLFYCLVVLLISSACAAQVGELARVKPHNAQQELTARELQGGDVQMESRRITVLSNVQLQPVDAAQNGTPSADATTIAHVLGYRIKRQSNAQNNSGAGPYIGAAYQHDTQEVGLIGKEIAIRFQDAGIPATYQSWKLQELFPNSGIYILMVSDLKQWLRAMRQLQSDPQVQSAQSKIMTTERTAK